MEILIVIMAYLIGSLFLGQVIANRKHVEINSTGTKNPGAFNIYNEVRLGICSGSF